MDITPYYIDARNAITQPEKMVFLSQYFRRNWMPILGPLGTVIVLFLRGECYHNRKSGELRDSVQLPQREIASGCGCSVPTLKRELERNEALRRFVQVSGEWERNGATGHVRQVENHYKVAMDDPLTEADESNLRRLVEERIFQERQAKESPASVRRKTIRTKEVDVDTLDVPDKEKSFHKNSSTACSTAVFMPVNNEVSNAVNNECSIAVRTAVDWRLGAKSVDQNNKAITSRSNGESTVSQPVNQPVAQNELLRPVAHFESTPIQNELLLNESLLKTTQKEKTLNVGEELTFISGLELLPKLLLDNDKPSFPKLRSRRSQQLDKLVNGLVAELQDFGSERRHYQLLDICQQKNLDDLPRQALAATRRRLASEETQGPLEKPGAYYQRILLALLEDHQVFVPKLGEGNPEEIRRLALQSLQDAAKS